MSVLPKAIHILAKKIGKEFTYDLLTFETNNKFKSIGLLDRKSLVVKFDIGQPLYFVEIDSSDNKFISTLVLYNINTLDHNKFIQILLNDTARDQGKWPEKSIANLAGFITIRHPRIYKKQKEELGNAAMENYEVKIANKFLRIFQS
ncbi:Tn7-like element transposition protein TnsE [Reichenbachiella ulvae]|uniref:Tn7-like element transposition protein TnsE n=1 Tax=Reichenbachiella ulvae TaxID=2980104 RepID=UPI00384E012E